MNKAIVILGMHRSGTSATAGLFSALGFSPGQTLLPANEYNKNGFFESEPIVTEHDRFLKILGHSWDDIRPLPLDWQQQADILNIENCLTEIFQREFLGCQRLVLKDPRLCRLLLIWQRLLDKVDIVPNYVLVLRRPEEVAASLLHRDGIPNNKGMLLYVAYLLDAERYTRKCKRVVVLYDDLLRDWLTVFAELNSTLDLQFDELSADVGKRVTEFLSPALRNFKIKSSKDSDIAGSPAVLAARLYSALARRSATTDGEIDDIQKDFDSHLAKLEPWLSDSAQLNRLKQEIVHSGPLFHAVLGRGAYAQLFWGDVDVDMSEIRSVRLPLACDQSVQCLRFVLPNIKNLVASLRIDISDRPVACQISRLSVEDEQGGLIWVWAVGTPLFEDCSEDMRVLDSVGAIESLHLIATGSDPYATLCIPKPVLDQLTGGWSIVVAVSVSPLASGVPILLSLAEQQHKALSDARASLQDIALETAVAASLTSAQQEKFRIEILRAEAQIDLLKDIWLSDGCAARL